MYKNLLRFSTLVLILLIILSTCILIKLNYQSNIISINPNEYSKILDEVHSNIDQYVGKKISVSGYVYIQDDFDKNNFVIAQNVLINSEEFVIGFLCNNTSGIPIEPYENITVTGKIEKCIYNTLQYPIIIVNKIT